MSNEEISLSDQAQTALAAYHGMRESKLGYFNYLQMIEEKYKDGGKASEEEEKALGDLLLAHDQQVTAFNQAMEQVVDADDRTKLIKLMQ